MRIRLHASLVIAVLLAVCISSAHAQKASKEQTAVSAAVETLTAAITGDSSANSAQRVRLAAELDLAQERWRLARVAANMDLAFGLAACTAGVQPDPEHNGPQSRGLLAQQFSQAIQVYNQAINQATQVLLQKESEAYQGHSQRASASLQSLAQAIQQVNQQFSQSITAGDLGPGVEPIQSVMPTFEAAPPTPDKDPEAACRAQMQAARVAYAKAVQEARDAALADAHKAVADGGSDAAKIQAALAKVSKRFQITAFDAFDSLDIAVKAALRKLELSTLE